MRCYQQTPSQVARSLMSGGTVPLSEIPLVQSAVSVRTLSLQDAVVVDVHFAERYGIDRRYRSVATLASHLGCPMVCANPLEWTVRELRHLWEVHQN